MNSNGSPSDLTFGQIVYFSQIGRTDIQDKNNISPLYKGGDKINEVSGRQAFSLNLSSTQAL